MKRVWWAVTLLIVILIITLYSCCLVLYASNAINYGLDQVWELCRHQKYNQAYDTALSVVQQFYTLEPQLALFIKRDFLACVSEALAGVPAYTHQNAELDLYNEIEKARSQVRAFKTLFFGIF